MSARSCPGKGSFADKIEVSTECLKVDRLSSPRVMHGNHLLVVLTHQTAIESCGGAQWALGARSTAQSIRLGDLMLVDQCTYCGRYKCPHSGIEVRMRGRWEECSAA